MGRDCFTGTTSSWLLVMWKNAGKKPFFSQHIMTKEEALPLLSSLSHLVKFLEHSKLSSYQMEKIAGIKNTASALCDLLEEGSSSVEGPAPAPCHMGTLIHENCSPFKCLCYRQREGCCLFS